MSDKPSKLDFFSGNAEQAYEEVIEQAKMRIRESTPKSSWEQMTIASTPPSKAMSSPSMRRRQLGDIARRVDFAGYWVHLETDVASIPRNPTLLEVNVDVSEWRIVGEDAWRIIDRLPKNGIFVYVY